MTLREAARAAPVGKLLPDALYVHREGLRRLTGLLRRQVSLARERLRKDRDFDLVKIDLRGKAVSFLRYPSFEADPHPALTRSVRVDLGTGEAKVRDYSRSKNPPILHRKELFVPAGFPGREKFKALTEAEERAGLLGSGKIGYQKQWEQLLQTRGLSVQGHQLVDTSAP